MAIPITLDVTLRQGDFSLEVSERFQATAVALFGPSGAGKTTMLDTIAGFRSPDRGEISIGSHVLFSSDRSIDAPCRERRVGYVPQDVAVFPHLGVRANILYGASRGRDASLDRVVAILEIGDLLDRRVDRLSGGERQRVALARAIMSSPDLLLLDEPLAALDMALGRRILRYLQRIRDELRVPILYVSHDEAEVRLVADWVIAVARGRVVASGPAGDVRLPAGTVG
jgi:molybdate transport system ATP-binding protein